LFRANNKIRGTIDEAKLKKVEKKTQNALEMAKEENETGKKEQEK